MCSPERIATHTAFGTTVLGITVLGTRAFEILALDTTALRTTLNGRTYAYYSPVYLPSSSTTSVCYQFVPLWRSSERVRLFNMPGDEVCIHLAR